MISLVHWLCWLSVLLSLAQLSSLPLSSRTSVVTSRHPDMATKLSVEAKPEEIVKWLEEKSAVQFTEEEHKALKGFLRTTTLLTQLTYSNLSLLGIAAERASAVLSVVVDLVKCHQVRAVYKDARKTKGIRVSMYRHAATRCAYYSIPDQSKSFWYDEGSDDLNIQLLFKNDERALIFRAFLSHLSLDNPIVVSHDAVKVEKDVQAYCVFEKELVPVCLDDYDGQDSDSPVQTLEDFKGAKSSSVSSTESFVVTDDLKKYQSIDRCDLVPFDKLYACHIKPKSQFKDLANDENNIIVGHWTPFHQYFDNLNLTAKHPVIAIKHTSVAPQPEVMTDSADKHLRTKVDLSIECFTQGVFDSIGTNLKVGSKKTSDTTWSTWVYVKDAKKFCEYLDWKYKFNKEQWEV